MIRFHATLSDESVYHRYFGFLKLENRTAHERLQRVCTADYDQQMPLIAELPSGEIIGVARVAKAADQTEAEVAAVISDAYQAQGIGSALVYRLLDFARDEHLKAVTASVLGGNTPMLRLLEKQGFEFVPDVLCEVMTGRLEL